MIMMGALCQKRTSTAWSEGMCDMDFTYLFTSLQGASTAQRGGQAFLLPAYPLAAKRLQDRDKRGETARYGYVPSIIAAGLLSFGPVEANPRTLELPIGDVDVSLNWNTNTLGVICFLILIGVTAWFLIELGMLKGTPGPNRFGPEPLRRPVPRAARTQRPRPRMAQASGSGKRSSAACCETTDFRSKTVSSMSVDATPFLIA